VYSTIANVEIAIMSDDQDTSLGVAAAAKGDEDSRQPMDVDDDGDDDKKKPAAPIVGPSSIEQIIDNHIATDKNLRPWWDEIGESNQKRSKSRILKALSGQPQDKFHVYYTKAFNLAYPSDDEEAQATGACVLYDAFVQAGIVHDSVPDGSGRVASLTLGLDQDYRGKFDLRQFQQRIEVTFKWYEDEKVRDEFISPSFSIIQSSGMGKTKLMKEYKKVTSESAASSSILVRLLLCVHGDTDPPADHQNHFDELLRVPNLTTSKLTMDEERKLLINNLDSIVVRSLRDRKTKEQQTKKIVLLIDEAHILVMEESQGRFYVALRWWLRRRRSNGLQIVAVFAGTLLSLANYQQIAPSQGWTRDVCCEYYNFDNSDNDDKKKKLYDPFYTFTTMAMEHVRVATSAWDGHKDALIDIRKCGYFGRPLFAAMLKAATNHQRELALLEEDAVCDQNSGTGHITNARLHSIMGRVLLSRANGWKESEDSIASVLATRVQLGIASYDFVAKVTSKGYGNLVHFRGVVSSDNNRSSLGRASIAFPPDPVCAALAMGLMQDSWSLSKPGYMDTIKGATPQFWVEKASAVFEQQLFLPYRGDAGEVFAALYMLLCGDELRKGEDLCLRKFEINLSPWLNSLVVQAVNEKRDQPCDSPKEQEAAKTKARCSPGRIATQTANIENPTAADPSGVLCVDDLKLNFIQVVRNYFRSRAWFAQNHLKFMYDVAVACYVYNNCPAFDLVFAIRDTSCKPAMYHPAFVSIKCWDAIDSAQMKRAVGDMKTYLDSYRKEGGITCLCILIVIGSRKVGRPPQGEGKFPKEDAFVTIVVPENDKFGVSNVIVKCAASSVQAEVLASHPFAHVEDPPSAALRVKTTGEDLAFGNGVLVDQGAGQEAGEAK
jgi:hypothetical protein